MRPYGTQQPVPSKPKEHEVVCLCGAPMRLRYSERFKDKPWFYGCSRYPACTTTHGCHQATGEPLGFPADKETKAWRIRAHAAFDRIWKEGHMARRDAYAWLASVLGLKEVHVGASDVAQCREIEMVSTEFFNGR